MRGALADDMLATDVAEYLVRAGMPFREAHHKAGEVVRLAEYLTNANIQAGEGANASAGASTGRSVPAVTLSQLTLAQLQSISPLFQADMVGPTWWDFERSVQSRDVPGGTHRDRVQDQIHELREWLAEGAAAAAAAESSTSSAVEQ